VIANGFHKRQAMMEKQSGRNQSRRQHGRDEAWRRRRFGLGSFN